LAFQFAERGLPRFIAEFKSEADKLALLHFAQAIIAEIGRSAVEIDRGDVNSSSNISEKASLKILYEKQEKTKQNQVRLSPIK
jgi:hypothetical protein